MNGNGVNYTWAKGSTKDEIRQYKTDNKLWFDAYMEINMMIYNRVYQ